LTLHSLRILLTIVSESPRCLVLNVNEGPDSVDKDVSMKDGEPFDRLASSPIGMLTLVLMSCKKSAWPRPGNMTRKIATMCSPDRTTWRETAPTPLPSLFFYHDRQTPSLAIGVSCLWYRLRFRQPVVISLRSQPLLVTTSCIDRRLQLRNVCKSAVHCEHSPLISVAVQIRPSLKSSPMSLTPGLFTAVGWATPTVQVWRHPYPQTSTPPPGKPVVYV
jgi:hypothetical protein